LRVYLAPCGIGLGHITRSAPIAEELNKRGIETVFSTYLDGLDYARHNKLPTYEAVPINFKVTNEGAIDFKMTAATSGFSLGIRMLLRQVLREIRFLKNFRPNVVFSDSRASSLIAARMMRIPVALMLNQFRVEIIRRPSNRSLSPIDRVFFFIANIGWLFIRTALEILWGRSQLILIPDFPSPYTISLGNLAIPKSFNGKVKLIGPIAKTQRTSEFMQRNTKRQLGFDDRKLLIYAAVSGPKVERDILTRILLEALPELGHKYTVVMSCGKPDGRARPYSRGGLIVYDWIENQDDFIKASDIVLSRAGHGTIMKSLSYGKPMILVPIPDHTEQYSNARRAVSLHVAEIIDQGKLGTETLRTAVERMLGSDEYRTSSQRINEVAASIHAVSTACDLVMGLADED
jgi:UDP-N-acetylglucosamine--N-acetylmuramyl-(pentapeptide) pyrophosphoryl-undecaprenol N-acetylglucosamine transferase